MADDALDPLDEYERLFDNGCAHGRKLRHNVGVKTAKRRPRARSASLATVLVVATAACGSGDSGAPESSLPTIDRSVVELGAESIQVGGAPWGVAIVGDSVWVSDGSGGTLLQVDASGGAVIAEVATGAPDPRDAGVVAADGQLWVANLGGTVGVLDAATGQVVARVTTGEGEPAAVALDDRWAWVPTHGPGGGLVRFDRARPDSEPLAVALPESGFAVAVDGETAWVAGLDGRVFAVDAPSGKVVRTFAVGGAPRGVAVADGDVWVSLRDARAVVRLDATTGAEVARIPAGGRPWPVASGAGFVWVATLEGRLLRVDPARDEVTAEAEVGREARGVAVGASAVWVTSQFGVLTRVSME